MVSPDDDAWWDVRLDEMWDEGTHFFHRPGYTRFGVVRDALPMVKARFPEIPFDPAVHDGRTLRPQSWWPACMPACARSLRRRFNMGGKFHRHTQRGICIVNYDNKPAQEDVLSAPLRRATEIMGWVTGGARVINF